MSSVARSTTTYAAAGKGSAKGKGKGGGAKGTLRHKKRFQSTTLGRCSLLRLCRRAGCRRVASASYANINGWARNFCASVLYTAATFCILNRRSTINFKDVMYALRKRGSPMLAGEEMYGRRNNRDLVAPVYRR